jgi:amino acid adenylation domain-containing protein
VALLIPKSPDAIIAMIAALKADATYTPLDSKNPPARIARVLQALEARCVLAVPSTLELLRLALEQVASSVPLPMVGLLGPRTDGQPLSTGFSLEEVAACSGEPVESRNASSDLAQILFTSGSTGAPKGVMITHGNVIQFVEWATRHFGMGPQDRVSGHSPLHFDLSTFDVYGAFAVGAELHPVVPELNLLPHRLAQFIREAELTQWFSVPSTLNHLAKFDAVREDDFPALRRLLWCGETFPTPGLIYWMRRLRHVEFTNLYGPTETTIASSYYRVPGCPEDPQSAIPIGEACDGEELLVLDDALRPVADGQVGELYIGGLGLSPGYWRDPERTAAAFVQRPGSGNADQRLYRTGDLAWIDPRGHIMLVGRADTQVKSRGYRIELGEIEAALNTIDELQGAAAVALQTDGFEGTQLGCAYVPRVGVNSLEPAVLRRRLAELLPTYMLPSRWKQLTHLPLNGNGKLDRVRLREILSDRPD